MTASKPGMPGHPMLPLAAIGVYLAGSVIVWLAAGLGGLMAGTGWTGGTPLTTAVDLTLGTTTWPGTTGWIALAGLVLVLAAPTVLVGLWIVRRRRSRKRVDGATKHLAAPSDFAAYAPDGLAESARRLRPSSTIAADDPAEHGMLIGDALPSNTEIRSSWEDVGVVIAGPRTGKSTSQVIPQIAEAPGPVLATSNKRDIHDATRGLREQGSRLRHRTATQRQVLQLREHPT